MTLSQPWGLLALSAIAVVLVIHLFQRRFRKRRIAGLFLWHEGLKQALTGRTVQPPPPTISLFLEILACVLLSLLLAGAGCEMAITQKHCVIVLDASGSMQASPGPEETFRKRANEEIKTILEKHDPDTLTLIASGKAPAFIFGPEGEPALAESALDDWTCLAYKHDLLAAITLAKHIEGQAGETFVITDHMPAGAAPPVTWISIGESLPNSAFAWAYRIRRDRDQDLVRLSLNRHGPPAPMPVRVREGDRVILEQTITPGQSSDLTFLVPAGAGLLTAELPQDALALDNIMLLPPPPVKTVRFLNTQQGVAQAILDRALLSVPDTEAVSAPPAELYAGAAADALKAPDDAWVLAFPPFPGDLLATKTNDDNNDADSDADAPANTATPVHKPATFLGPYTLDTLQPLLASVSLQGVAWHAPAVLNPTAVPLVACGDRALVMPAPAPHRGFLFNLDLARTNLFQTQAWPVMIYNLVESVRTTLPGPNQTLFRAGDTLSITLPPFSSGEVVLQGRDWSETLPYQQELYVNLPPITMALNILDGHAVQYRLAVNWLDMEESDLTGLASGRIQGDPKEAIQTQQKSGWSDPLFQVLLWLLAAALLANWWITQRGRAS